MSHPPPNKQLIRGSFLIPLQVFLFVNASGQSLPEMVFNFSITEGEKEQYRHVPYEVVPPACVPSHWGEKGFMCLKATIPNGEPLLPSVLRSGVFFTAEQLQCIRTELKLPPLAKGSGKKGAVIKADIARQVVDAVLPGLPPKERSWILSKLMAQSVKKITEDEQEVLEMVRTLDPENQECFGDMSRFAREKLKESLKKQGVKEFIRKRKLTFMGRFALRASLKRTQNFPNILFLLLQCFSNFNSIRLNTYYHSCFTHHETWDLPGSKQQEIAKWIWHLLHLEKICQPEQSHQHEHSLNPVHQDVRK